MTQFGSTSAPIDQNEHPHESLVIDITGMIKALETPLSPECCIYRVPRKLKQLNEAAYTPQIISIGPLHHGTKQLETMEKHKVRHLNDFLQRNARLEDFISSLKGRETRIRSCYAESFEPDIDKFVKMILLDASFIIEHFWRSYDPRVRDANDKVLYKPWLKSDIYRDLILLENQLPFFLLEELYDLAFITSTEDPSFRKLTTAYFSGYNNQDKSIPENIKHFTDLIRFFHLPISLPQAYPGSSNDSNNQNDSLIRAKVKHFKHLINHYLKHLITHCLTCLLPWCRPPAGFDFEISDSLPTATELLEAGVKFKMSPSKCWLNVQFTEGELEIPRLELDDETESLIRNLMALEQCHYPIYTTICSYISLLDDLIDSTKDVDLLVRNQIVYNGLGHSDAVAKLVNSLCREISCIDFGSHWHLLGQEVNKHYKVPWNSWKAACKRDYFSTPWKIASTIAAVILLFLTFIQTVFSAYNG